MPVVNVSQLNSYIKKYFDQNPHLSDLWVKGEISNCKKHYSGHIYLTLKDEGSLLKAVMFKQDAAKLKFDPSDGMKVLALGKVGVYEAGGVYQLYVEDIIPDGKGELYAAFEQLKLKLQSEGMFSPEYKKPLPPFPERVGVITSASGAALRDVLNVLKRRYPVCDVIVYPVKVQGIGASDSICKGLGYFSDTKKCDVIILARGGGSIEDLWAFNEEKTARAVFECSVPVITGVGHETDYTICDFVSDMRAPTPSAAAEICVPFADEILANIQKALSGAFSFVKSKLDYIQSKVDRYDSSYAYSKLMALIKNYELVNARFRDAALSCINTKITALDAKTDESHAKIDALNPFSVIKRGYSIALSKEGKVFDWQNAVCDDEFDLIFDGGKAVCNVRRIEK